DFLNFLPDKDSIFILDIWISLENELSIIVESEGERFRASQNLTISIRFSFLIRAAIFSSVLCIPIFMERFYFTLLYKLYYKIFFNEFIYLFTLEFFIFLDSHI